MAPKKRVAETAAAQQQQKQQRTAKAAKNKTSAMPPPEAEIEQALEQPAVVQEVPSHMTPISQFMGELDNEWGNAQHSSTDEPDAASGSKVGIILAMPVEGVGEDGKVEKPAESPTQATQSESAAAVPTIQVDTQTADTLQVGAEGTMPAGEAGMPAEGMVGMEAEPGEVQSADLPSAMEAKPGEVPGADLPAAMGEKPGEVPAAGMPAAMEEKPVEAPGQQAEEVPAGEQAHRRSLKRKSSLSAETLRFGESPKNDLEKDEPAADAESSKAEEAVDAKKQRLSPDAQSEGETSPALSELARAAKLLRENPDLREMLLKAFPSLDGLESSPTGSGASSSGDSKAGGQFDTTSEPSSDAAASEAAAAASRAQFLRWQHETLSPTCDAVAFDSITTLKLASQEKGMPHCGKCGKEVDPFRGQIKSKSSETDSVKWICRECNCIVTNLSRNMQWPPKMFDSMNKDEQEEFFRNAQNTRGGDSRFKYGLLRATLLTSMVKRQVKTKSAAVEGTFMPLSWYEKKGCTKEQLLNIERDGEFELHPIFGETYRVPLKTIGIKVVTEAVEESILKAESLLKAKTKKELEDQPEVKSVEDAFQTEEEEKVPEPARVVPEPERTPEEIKAAEEAAKKEAERKEKEDKKAKLQAEKNEKTAISRHNTAMANLATKVVTATTQTLQKLTACQKHSCFSQVPAVITDQFDTFIGDLKDKQAKSKELLSKQAKAAATGAKLPDLEFAFKDIQKLAKDANDQVRKAEDILKVLKK